jgi:hypothetical protein
MVMANLPFAQDALAPLAVANLRVNNLTHSGGAIVGYVSGSSVILETEASGTAPTALPMDTACSIRFSATYFV